MTVFASSIGFVSRAMYAALPRFRVSPNAASISGREVCLDLRRLVDAKIKDAPNSGRLVLAKELCSLLYWAQSNHAAMRNFDFKTNQLAQSRITHLATLHAADHQTAISLTEISISGSAAKTQQLIRSLATTGSFSHA